MSNTKTVVIVGGHGKVALRLSRLLTPFHQVSSIIRNEGQIPDLESVYTNPVLLSLESDPTSKFTKIFQGKDVVYFCAGAGGKGGAERTKKVDFEGAVKVFDAIDAIQDPKQRPRLIMVSAIDVRDPKKVPEHYTDGDVAVSQSIRETIPVYMDCKYEADKELLKRKGFKWTIVRPGGLTDDPETGNVHIGQGHITEAINREDLAAVLAKLVNREDAAGLAMDVTEGDEPIEEALNAFIKKGKTDFEV